MAPSQRLLFGGNFCWAPHNIDRECEISTIAQPFCCLSKFLMDPSTILDELSSTRSRRGIKYYTCMKNKDPEELRPFFKFYSRMLRCNRQREVQGVREVFLSKRRASGRRKGQSRIAAGKPENVKKNSKRVPAKFGKRFKINLRKYFKADKKVVGKVRKHEGVLLDLERKKLSAFSAKKNYSRIKITEYRAAEPKPSSKQDLTPSILGGGVQHNKHNNIQEQNNGEQNNRHSEDYPNKNGENIQLNKNGQKNDENHDHIRQSENENREKDSHSPPNGDNSSLQRSTADPTVSKNESQKNSTQAEGQKSDQQPTSQIIPPHHTGQNNSPHLFLEKSPPPNKTPKCFEAPQNGKQHITNAGKTILPTTKMAQRSDAKEIEEDDSASPKSPPIRKPKLSHIFKHGELDYPLNSPSLPCKNSTLKKTSQKLPPPNLTGKPRSPNRPAKQVHFIGVPASKFENEFPFLNPLVNEGPRQPSRKLKKTSTKTHPNLLQTKNAEDDEKKKLEHQAKNQMKHQKDGEEKRDEKNDKKNPKENQEEKENTHPRKQEEKVEKKLQKKEVSTMEKIGGNAAGKNEGEKRGEEMSEKSREKSKKDGKIDKKETPKKHVQKSKSRMLEIATERSKKKKTKIDNMRSQIMSDSKRISPVGVERNKRSCTISWELLGRSYNLSSSRVYSRPGEENVEGRELMRKCVENRVKNGGENGGNLEKKGDFEAEMLKTKANKDRSQYSPKNAKEIKEEPKSLKSTSDAFSPLQKNTYKIHKINLNSAKTAFIRSEPTHWEGLMKKRFGEGWEISKCGEERNEISKHEISKHEISKNRISKNETKIWTMRKDSSLEFAALCEKVFLRGPPFQLRCAPFLGGDNGERKVFFFFLSFFPLPPEKILHKFLTRIEAEAQQDPSCGGILVHTLSHEVPIFKKFPLLHSISWKLHNRIFPLKKELAQFPLLLIHPHTVPLRTNLPPATLCVYKNCKGRIYPCVVVEVAEDPGKENPIRLAQIGYSDAHILADWDSLHPLSPTKDFSYLYNKKMYEAFKMAQNVLKKERPIRWDELHPDCPCCDGFVSISSFT